MKKFCQIALIVIAISAVSGCILFNEDAVKLNNTLAMVTGGALNEGTVIDIGFIRGGKVEQPFLPDCACVHLHAVDPVGITIVTVAGSGPFPDPDIGGCGYGCIGREDIAGNFVPNVP